MIHNSCMDVKKKEQNVVVFLHCLAETRNTNNRNTTHCIHVHNNTVTL